MTQAPDFEDDDDTARLGDVARRKIVGVRAAISAMAVQQTAHEQLDARRWRTAAWVMGVVLAAAGLVGGVAWQAQAETAADRARLEDVQTRLTRIESQLDRLMERADR